MIYLDNAATTKVDPEVSALLSDLFVHHYGNASSSHKLGVKYKNIWEKAKLQVASLLACKPENIIFTSGATESNNTFFYNIALQSTPDKRKVLVSPIEHPSVLEVAKSYQDRGMLDIELLAVNENGWVDVQDLRNRIDRSVAAVLVMAVNNETGVLQPVEEISKICREHHVHFHCDFVQALGRVVFCEALFDSASFSAHKVYGPKGIGALYIRSLDRFHPFVAGGGQQANLRSGTEPVELIAGFGLACEKLKHGFAEYNRHMRGLKECMLENIRDIPEIALNASQNTVPHIINLSIDGIRSDSLALIFEQNDVLISQGSACSSNQGHKKLSHVLTAMGLPEKKIRSSFRISFGQENTLEEVDFVCKLIKTSLEKYKVRW